MARRNISVMRLGRCIAFLVTAAFLLPFTILLMLADQQYNLTYNSRRVFYQESDFYKINGSFNSGALTVTTPFSFKYLYDNNATQDYLLSKEKFMEVHDRMEARRQYLRTECSRLGLDNQKANSWEFLINEQYHVIWCNVFKAASTSWMYNFNRMANYSAAFLDSTKEVPLQLARKRYARPTLRMIKKAQQESITFMIVRHPMERLASAYNDKIVHSWPRSYHDVMGRKIIIKYRKTNGKKKVDGPKTPLFEEFVQHILDEDSLKRTLDMHWTPYTKFCTPCKVHFDIILKFETLGDDQKYLIQLAHLQDVVKPEWRNVGKGNNTKNVSQLFSRLTRKQLDGLSNLYRYDLQLFNYTMDNYYDLLPKEESDGKTAPKSNSNAKQNNIFFYFH